MTLSTSTSFDAERVIDDGDMLLRRALPHAAIRSIGPFVFIDHYRHRSRRGLGDLPHPHAGIEVVSYLLEGEVHHRDSMGFSDVIRAGEVQVICAGRGMLHVEKPAGGRHGLQMWTSLPPDLKRTEPTYRHFASGDLPVLQDEHGAVRAICGRVNGLEGSVQLARKTLLAHVSMPEGCSRRVELEPDQEVAVYVLGGKVAIDGGVQDAGALRGIDPSHALHMQARTACDVLIFGGVRIDERILFSGPFVMDTEEGLRQAHLEYLGGSMGALDGVPRRASTHATHIG